MSGMKYGINSGRNIRKWYWLVMLRYHLWFR